MSNVLEYTHSQNLETSRIIMYVLCFILQKKRDAHSNETYVNNHEKYTRQRKKRSAQYCYCRVAVRQRY